MQQQHTIIVHVLTEDYIKVSGFAIVHDELMPIRATFKGIHAKQIALDWVESMKVKIEEGIIEARIIVQGELSDVNKTRDALTMALFG